MTRWEIISLYEMSKVHDSTNVINEVHSLIYDVKIIVETLRRNNFIIKYICVVLI